ncbi:MAG: hypothetical protein K0Q73_7568 [Paenibacillus sp.]|nr:hypothetical protein [Paenibacillus sp.]
MRIRYICFCYHSPHLVTIDLYCYASITLRSSSVQGKIHYNELQLFLLLRSKRQLLVDRMGSRCQFGLYRFAGWSINHALDGFLRQKRR